MNRSTPGFALALASFGLMSFFTACSSSPSNEVLQISGNPLTFHLVKSNDPKLFASTPEGDVTIEQVTEGSAVEADLNNQRHLVHLEAALRKFAAETKDPKSTATLNVFVAKPERPLPELLKQWSITLPAQAKVVFGANPPAKDVIAQWGDQQMTAADADNGSARLALIKSRAYREDLNRLTGIVMRRALLKAAQGEKLEIDTYLQKHVNVDTAPLSENEYEAFLAARGIKKGDVNEDQEKSLRSIALDQRRSEKVNDYVVHNLLKGDVDVHVFPPQFAVKVPEGWNSIWGVKDAPVSILYFGDLVCGPCRGGLKNVIDVANDFKGHVHVGFNFLFSPSDRDSRMISEAALCVQAQGNAKFAKFAEIYADLPPPADEAGIESAARQAGAKLDDYKKCFLAREHQALLNQHLEFADHLGIQSQPTVLVDGEPLAGTISKAELNDVVQRKVNAKSSALGALWRRFKALFA
jgi:hypothetical protein